MKKFTIYFVLFILVTIVILTFTSCSKTTYEVNFDFNISTRYDYDSFPDKKYPKNIKIVCEENSFVEEPNLSEYLKKFNQRYRYYFSIYDHRDSHGIIYKFTYYNFSGWYQDSGLLVPWKFATDTVKTNMTLYAKWEMSTGYGYKFNSKGETINAVMPLYDQQLSLYLHYLTGAY